MKITSLFDKGGPDKLIDELVKMSREYSMQDGIDHIWNEFVPKHIAQLDCQFFDHFMERISNAGAAGDKARLKNLLGMVLNAVVSACQEPIHELTRMTDRRDLAEKDVEGYLKAAEKRYHFVLYPGVIFMFMQLYQQWERLHTPQQAWEGPILRMVVRVAGRLQPDAKKVAALIATAAPD
jgi:hypothetical protein